MIDIKDVLNLVGGELKDGNEQSKRFREFIEQDKWTIDYLKRWVDECITQSSGAHDPYNRAFQDLITSLGRKLGFEIEYGRYAGKSGENNFDGIWKRSNGDIIVLESKTSTWPIGSVNQLGNYIEELYKKEQVKNVFGLYVIGKGDIQPLTEQILGSKFKDRMRLIIKEDLIELLALKEDMEPVIGKNESIEKVQDILLPIESINIGNIIRLILDIAMTKSTTGADEIEVEEIEKVDLEELNEPWTNAELKTYLKDAKPYQRLLLASLVQADKEPTTRKIVIFLMKEIAKRRPSEGIEKDISGRDIAGARAGLKMRRKPFKKEDVIDSSWSAVEHDYIYKLRDNYKQTITDWVKGENLWIKDEIG
jgi:hypothetical protein